MPYWYSLPRAGWAQNLATHHTSSMMAVVACAVVTVLVVSFFLWNYSRLKSIPGPLTARFSGFGRLYAQNSSGYGRYLTELHQKYGKLVRLGPSFVSLCDQAKISQIYRIHLDEELSQSYSNSDVLHSSSIFHNVPTRQFQNISQYEGLIDRSARNIVVTIRRHRILDITASLWFFANEFIEKAILNDLTGQNQSKRSDDQGSLNRSSSRSGSICLPLPTVEDIILRGPAALLKRERLSCSGVHLGVSAVPIPEKGPNMLNEVKCSNQASNTGFSALESGVKSITTAFVSAFHFLLTQPAILSTLRHEIDTAFRNLTPGRAISWTEIRRLSYLDSVMKESLRHLSASSLYQEILKTSAIRGVPGVPLPNGITVGWHPQALQFNCSIYGDRVDSFRPDRWLTTDEQQRSLMEQCLVPLSVSLETCPKLHAAWLELKKTIVILLREFDIQPLELSRERPNCSEFFNCPPSMMVKFTPRIPPN